MTDTPTPELYDQQIDAILSGNFGRFSELLSLPVSFDNEIADLEDHDESYAAQAHVCWLNTGSNKLSLFAYLPGCLLCASQIEHCDEVFLTDREQQLSQLVLTNRPVDLPDLQYHDHDEDGTGGEWTPTRAQLEEFKRRQMLARGMGAMRQDEFDPASERHYGGILLKRVDPGCTFELQIENLQTGEVQRITTTDSSHEDQLEFHRAVFEAVDSWLKSWKA